MTRIAKKPRSVKGQKQAKPSPPRYSIRTDALSRRYAIDSRTGKRVPIARAEKELERRKSIPRNIPTKKPKKSRVSKKRSEASKKGWETRRKKAAMVIEIPEPPSSAKLIPPGILMVPLEGPIRRERILERAARYPKVAEAANLAWLKLQAAKYNRLVAMVEGSKPPPMATRRFDQEHGEGDAERIHILFEEAEDLNDIDNIIDRLTEEEDYTARELYTLYFSPEVA